MAFTTDMYAGIQQIGDRQLPVPPVDPVRFTATLARQPNTETSNFSETVPANYKERITFDKIVMCLPTMPGVRY